MIVGFLPSPAVFTLVPPLYRVYDSSGVFKNIIMLWINGENFRLFLFFIIYANVINRKEFLMCETSACLRVIYFTEERWNNRKFNVSRIHLSAQSVASIYLGRWIWYIRKILFRRMRCILTFIFWTRDMTHTNVKFYVDEKPP